MGSVLMSEDDMSPDRQLCMAVASAWVQLVAHLVARGVAVPDELKRAVEEEATRFDELGRHHAAQFTRLMAAHIDSMPRHEQQ
jgi:hypothetical protein